MLRCSRSIRKQPATKGRLSFT